MKHNEIEDACIYGRGDDRREVIEVNRTTRKVTYMVHGEVGVKKTTLKSFASWASFRVQEPAVKMNRDVMPKLPPSPPDTKVPLAKILRDEDPDPIPEEAQVPFTSAELDKPDGTVGEVVAEIEQIHSDLPKETMLDAVEEMVADPSYVDNAVSTDPKETDKFMLTPEQVAANARSEADFEDKNGMSKESSDLWDNTLNDGLEDEPPYDDTPLEESSVCAPVLDMTRGVISGETEVELSPPAQDAPAFTGDTEHVTEGSPVCSIESDAVAMQERVDAFEADMPPPPEVPYGEPTTQRCICDKFNIVADQGFEPVCSDCEDPKHTFEVNGLVFACVPDGMSAEDPPQHVVKLTEGLGFLDDVVKSRCYGATYHDAVDQMVSHVGMLILDQERDARKEERKAARQEKRRNPDR